MNNKKLNIIEVLKDAFDIYKNNFMLLTVISFIITLIKSVNQFAYSPGVFYNLNKLPVFNWVGLLISIVTFLLYIPLTIILY